MKLTEQRKQVFLDSLREHGVVTRAARESSPRCKFGVMTFRDERKRDSTFAARWDEAVSSVDQRPCKLERVHIHPNLCSKCGKKPSGRKTKWCDSCRTKKNEQSRRRRATLSGPPGDRITLMLRYARCRARNRGLEFNLGSNDIVIPDRCPALGCDWKNDVPSLDRIDDDKGYVPENIIVVSVRANRIRNTYSSKELRQVADFYAGIGL